MKKETVWFATVEWENYTVNAIGKTKDEAKKAVQKTINKSFGERVTMKRLEEYNGIWASEMVIGEGWLD